MDRDIPRRIGPARVAADPDVKTPQFLPLSAPAQLPR